MEYKRGFQNRNNRRRTPTCIDSKEKRSEYQLSLLKSIRSIIGWSSLTEQDKEMRRVKYSGRVFFKPETIPSNRQLAQQLEDIDLRAVKDILSVELEVKTIDDKEGWLLSWSYEIIRQAMNQSLDSIMKEIKDGDSIQESLNDTILLEDEDLEEEDDEWSLQFKLRLWKPKPEQDYFFGHETHFFAPSKSSERSKSFLRILTSSEKESKNSNRRIRGNVEEDFWRKHLMKFLHWLIQLQDKRVRLFLWIEELEHILNQRTFLFGHETGFNQHILGTIKHFSSATRFYYYCVWFIVESK